MLIHQKIKLNLNPIEKEILDNQLKLCIKLSNLILESFYNHEREDFMFGHIVSVTFLKKVQHKILNEHPYFKIIHIDTLDRIIYKLKKSIETSLKRTNSLPKYKQSRKNSFLLYYLGSTLSSNIINKSIEVPLGFVLSNNTPMQLKINCKLSSRIHKRENSIISNYEIVKKYNHYFLLVCINKRNIKSREKTGKAISIDPNHKNFFVGVDSEGKSIEFQNLYQLKYFDKRIDEVRSKRDRCSKKSKSYLTLSGTEHLIPSKRYERMNNILLELYHKRNSQITHALYSIANYLVQNYDQIAIGNYTPTSRNIKYREMRRKMINQTIISRLRDTVKYVCQRDGKKYILVNEMFTTAKCFNCGNLVKKDPEIRIFTCDKCKRVINRDINSAINIGIKANILSRQDYVDLDLSLPTYALSFNLQKQKIDFLKLKG